MRRPRISAVNTMTNIIRFKPRATLEAEANLRRFIDLCRNELHQALGADLPFDENAWDISDFVHVKGKQAGVAWCSPSCRQVASIRESRSRSRTFLAKAYMRHEFAIRRKWFIEVGINALRACIERWRTRAERSIR